MAGPLHRLPGAGFYEDAAAAKAAQTPRLAASLAYCASNGKRPPDVTALPARAAAKHACAGAP